MTLLSPSAAKAVEGFVRANKKSGGGIFVVCVPCSVWTTGVVSCAPLGKNIKFEAIFISKRDLGIRFRKINLCSTVWSSKFRYIFHFSWAPENPGERRGGTCVQFLPRAREFGAWGANSAVLRSVYLLLRCVSKAWRGRIVHADKQGDQQTPP